MHRINQLNIDSLIRIFNFFENDNGYGNQIMSNCFEDIFDMQDNFDWSDKTVLLSIKCDGYKINDKYIQCNFDGFVSTNETELRKWIVDFIKNIGTPTGELLEIIEEEYYINNINGEIL